MRDEQVVAIIAAILRVGDNICGQLVQEQRGYDYQYHYDSREDLIEEARGFVEAAGGGARPPQ